LGHPPVVNAARSGSRGADLHSGTANVDHPASIDPARAEFVAATGRQSRPNAAQACSPDITSCKAECSRDLSGGLGDSGVVRTRHTTLGLNSVVGGAIICCTAANASETLGSVIATLNRRVR